MSDLLRLLMGWFGIDDLIAWTEDAGPIVIAVAWDADAHDDEALVQHARMRWAGIDTI